MKKKLYLTLLGGILLLVLIQCSKKEDTPPTPPVNYSVQYMLQLTGDYTDLKAEYFQTGNNWQELTNPAVPWQVTFTNFVSGDSVKLEISFLTVIGKSYAYSGGYTVNGNPNIDGGSETNVPVVKKVQDQWVYKIP